MSESSYKNAIPHLLLDRDFFTKPKTMRLIRRFGHEGASVLLHVCCTLLNANDGKLQRADVEVLFSQLQIDEIEYLKIIDYCIEIGWFLEENGYIFSKRVREEREKVLKNRDTWRKNGKKGGRPKTKRKPKANQTANPLDMDSKTRSTYTYTYTYIDNKKIVGLSEQEAQAFVLNYFHGNETLFVQRYEHCLDHVKAHKKEIHDMAAYFRNWLKTHREMYGTDPCVPGSLGKTKQGKNSAFDENMKELERLQGYE